jgi:hypothetical protein
MMGLKFILEKGFDLVSKLFRNQENFENKLEIVKIEANKELKMATMLEKQLKRKDNLAKEEQKNEKRRMKLEAEVKLREDETKRFTLKGMNLYVLNKFWSCCFSILGVPRNMTGLGGI